MSQSEHIKWMLEHNEWVCANDIINSMRIIDYRARISGLKKKGMNIRSEPCHGRCGRKHTANMYRYQLIRTALPVREEEKGGTETAEGLFPTVGRSVRINYQLH